MSDYTDLGATVDRTWILLTSGIVFTMQFAFPLLEAGNVRRKNWGVIWQRTFLNVCITIFTWWLMGYAIAFGGSYDRFVAGRTFFAGDAWDDSSADIDLSTQYSLWFNMVVTAMIVPAVTNMSLSERISLKASAIHTFLMTCFIFPIIVTWTWGAGWLNNTRHFYDFAGAGVVFVTAGFAGLAGLIFLGNRHTRGGQAATDLESVTTRGQEVNFNLHTLRDRVQKDTYETSGVSNITYMIFGGLLLWFQLTFLAAGKSIFMSYSLGWLAAEKAATNTFLGGSSAAVIGLALKPIITGESRRTLSSETKNLVNSFLSGVITNLAGLESYEPWEALVVGAIGVCFYMVACAIINSTSLDDPTEAFQTFGVSGMAGLGLEAFFNHYNGIFHHDPTAGRVLGNQMLGWLVIAGWSFCCSAIIYGILKVTKSLRVSTKTELVGYDYKDYADHLSADQLIKERGDRTEREVMMSAASPKATEF